MAVFLVGCSDRPTTYPISGKAQFSDGTPVQFGQIETFQGELKLNARGQIQKDGSFQLETFAPGDGAVAGKHKVVITQFSAPPLSGQVGFETIEHSHGHELSKKYGSYDTSPLEFELIPGETENVVLEIDDFKVGSSGHHN